MAKPNQLSSRNSSLDIIRIFAAFMVLSVHFFLYNGFYSEPVNKPAMFVAVGMRTFFGICVPLFMILTGYLMCHKTLSRDYYKGIRKTLIVFVLATIACMIFKMFHDNPAIMNAFGSGNFGLMFKEIGQTRKYGLINFIFGTLDFTGANYSWYIEMYIGLFLIAPFLNLAYNKLNSQKHKLVLVVTMFCLTTLPTIFNIFNFDTATWWVTPTESDTYQKLIPAFWLSMYPITYYFTGAYLREYGMKLRTRAVAVLLVISLLGFTTFNWFRSYNGGFKTGLYNYWYGFTPYVLSLLVFVLLSRIKSDNWKPGVKKALWKVSDLALGIYLCSYIFDVQIYERLNKTVPVMTDRLPYYFLTVPLCFVLAALLSLVLNLIAKGIIKLIPVVTNFWLKIWRSEGAQRQRYCDIFFIVLMLATAIFAFWKCFFGFGGYDEGFYQTIPHRLLKGDAFFADEWNLSQLSGFLLLPFTWLYTAFAGSTDGIILAARIFYLICHTGATVAIYSRVRKYGAISVIGCVLYFLYTPYNIMALSYNTMGVELLLLSGVLLATADYTKKLQLIFSGLALAGAVLCNPYLAVVYVLYLIAVGVHYLLRKRDMKMVLKSEMFSGKALLFFTIGVAALAVVFLIFLLTRTGINDIFKNLPYMLDDPEHPHIGFGAKVGSYFSSIFGMHPHFCYVVYVYGAMLLAMIIDRKRQLHRSIYLLISAGCTVVALIQLMPTVTTTTYNAIMLPMLMVSITSYILVKNKPRELFAAVFITGIVYSFVLHYSSNQALYCISMAMTISNFAGFIFLSQLIREMREEPDSFTYMPFVKTVSFSAIAVLIALQGGLQITSKAYHVFWDVAPDACTTQIDNGPAKGLKVSPAKRQEYYTIYNDLMSAKTAFGSGKFLSMSKNSWTYLAMNDCEYATFSGWLSGETANTLNRLKTYQTLNPEKIPQLIYLPKTSGQNENNGWNAQAVMQEYAAQGYAVSETDNSYLITKK